MQASNFEFRYRFFILGLLYALTFSLRVFPSIPTLAESLARWSGFTTRPSIQLFFALGALIIAAGAILRTWATAYLQGEIVHDMAMHSDRLIADGPYAHVRNPLYLGSILLAAGIGFLAPWPNWCFLVGATLFFCMRLILREEAGLAATQPASFFPFKAAVPRLIPSLTRRVPPSGKRPHWPQAFLAESFMWGFALSMLVFSITLNGTAFTVTTLLILSAYAVLHVLNSRRQSSLARGR